MKEHGLYKYVYNGQIIYIGKSNNSIKSRINGHKKEDKFQPFLDKSKIYVCMLPNSTETDLMEMALINHYKPILNVQFNHPSFSNLIHFQEPEWMIYHDVLSFESDLNSNLETAETKLLRMEEQERMFKDAKIILKTSRKVRKDNKFIEAYNFLLEKIEDGDYLRTSGDYLTKGRCEPLYRFDITELAKDDTWKALFYYGGFPFYRRESAIAGRTYIYVRNLRDIKNIYDATA